MQVEVSEMRLEADGPHLTFTSEYEPEFSEPIVKADSTTMLQGGDVKTLRALLTDVRMQMVAKDGGKLDLSLYNYREQLQAGLMDVTPAGGFVAYLGPHVAADYVPQVDTEDKSPESEGAGNENLLPINPAVSRNISGTSQCGGVGPVRQQSRYQSCQW